MNPSIKGDMRESSCWWSPWQVTAVWETMTEPGHNQDHLQLANIGGGIDWKNGAKEGQNLGRTWA